MNRFRLSMIGASSLTAVGLALGLTAPASASVSTYLEPNTVEIGSTAVLGARGAVVTIPVTFVCDGLYGAAVHVEVTEKVGSGIATGGSDAYVSSCTGDIQQVDVQVSPQGDGADQGRAFKQGPAWVRVSLEVHHTAFVEVAGEVRFVK